MSDSPSKAGQFCWNELHTTNPGQASEFYSALFGWVGREIDMPAGTYTIFKQGENDVAGMMQRPQEQTKNTPSKWLSYIYVDDIDAMFTKAKEAGAQIVQPVTVIPNYGRFFIMQDPTGAQLALWQST